MQPPCMYAIALNLVIYLLATFNSELILALPSDVIEGSAKATISVIG